LVYFPFFDMLNQENLSTLTTCLKYR
jgi:hypothetical protein